MKRVLLLILCLAVTPLWAATEWVQAQVVEVPQDGQITLSHAAIKSLGMGPMTMPFLVDSGIALGGFKVGDKVRFTVHRDGDYLKIDALVHRP